MKKKINHFNPLFNGTSVVIYLLIAAGCNRSAPRTHNIISTDDSMQICITLDQFNEAAANADFQTYFDFYTDDAVFIGTDATERWDKKSFMPWAKPHFDKKKTWKFKSIDRHIYLNKENNFAWFDELLNTQMKICRGSGVLVKQNNKWKVQQYVLSMTIPNDITDTVVKTKAPLEEQLIQKMLKK